MDNANDASSANSASQSSDKSFYVFMLVIIVAMAFYISYDMDERYGTSAENSNSAAAETNNEPDVISGEKAATAKVKSTAEAPATETAPETVIEKTEQKTVQATTVIPALGGVIVIPKVKSEQAAPAEAASKAEQVVEKKSAPEAAAPTPGVLPIVDSMIKTVETITKPVVEATETAADIVQSAPAQAAPAYNPYDNQYGRPYQGYQQPQQYGNPYGNSYNNNQYGNPYNNNPYGNPYNNNNSYNNPYANPYGNPYQQPAQ